jgi:hypothetical protein
MYAAAKSAPDFAALNPGYKDEEETSVSSEMRCGTWVEHFPGSLRWTNAMQIVKGMAAYGAVAMEEVDRVGARLAARAGESDPDRA